MTQTRIMLIDNSPIELRLLGDGLERAGYDVVCLQDATDAVETAARINPDFIILDLFMPGHDGRKVCAALKVDMRTKHVPIMFLTASQSITDVIQCMHIGVIDYIPKPIQVSAFIEKIRIHELIASLRKDWGKAIDSVNRFAEKYGTTHEKNN